MIDLEEIQSRLDQGVASLTDAHDLLREVERLRELLLNAGWPREAESIAKVAQQAERAVVVAWIRRMATDARDWRGVASVLDSIFVDAFESSVPRREGDE